MYVQPKPPRLKRRVGRERGLNCWLFVFCLLCRGRLSGIVVSRTSRFPHVLGVTKRGNVVHFRRTRGRERAFSPWFYGRAEALGREYLDKLATLTLRVAW